MNRVLFLSRCGDGCDIALRMSADNNHVLTWIREKDKYGDVYDGLIEKVEDWKPYVAQSDMVVFDNNDMPEIREKIGGFKPCFGGSRFGYRLEHDRGFGRAVMERAGLRRMESIKLKTHEQVIEHLKKHKVPHVIKPEGKKVDSYSTIIGELEDNSDAIALMERLRSTPVESFDVEEKKKGIEIALSRIFNGKDWVGPICVNFEHKRSNDGEVGYLTGEQGTLVRYEPNPENPLFLKTLARMAPFLKDNDYRGIIDINMIIDLEDKEWPLEFTVSRFGYPLVFIQDELHITPWYDLLKSAALGKQISLMVHYDWAIGVCLDSFGFPFDDKYMKYSYELPVSKLEPEHMPHIHLCQCKIKGGRVVTSHGDGWTLVATGRGDAIETAKEKAYEHLKKISVVNSFYRSDIGDKIKGEVWRLKQLGYIHS